MGKIEWDSEQLTNLLELLDTLDIDDDVLASETATSEMLRQYVATKREVDAPRIQCAECMARAAGKRARATSLKIINSARLEYRIGSVEYVQRRGDPEPIAWICTKVEGGTAHFEPYTERK